MIFDVYITEKVHWAFWKKKGVKKQTKFVEWVDALIFAVIAATLIRMFFVEAYTIPTSSMEKSMLVGDYLFVSKVAYGPKMPNTPLAVPFTHHTLPGTKSTKAYSELIKEYAESEENGYTFLRYSSEFNSAVATLKTHVQSRNNAVNSYLN